MNHLRVAIGTGSATGRKIPGSEPVQAAKQPATPSQEPRANGPAVGSPKNHPPSPPTPPKEWAAPHPAKNFSFGHPSFAPEWGRVTRGFDGTPERREWQAEQILRRFGQWPPPEGEVYVIQIDQDSPPPPPPFPKPTGNHAEFLAKQAAWKQAILELNAYLTSFSGETSVFRAQRVAGHLKLVELNPQGPFRSASHPGQLDPAGQASCNGTVCGMAWLRSGIYPYKAGTLGLFNPVQDSLMEVARDVNFDGAIDRRDSLRSARAFGLAIQIHAGFPGSPRSVGCQTLPPPDFTALQQTVAGTKAPTFSYVLVRRPNEKFGERIW
ncbi:MAG: hypothetical protein U1F66_09550 [bacterium]